MGNDREEYVSVVSAVTERAQQSTAQHALDKSLLKQFISKIPLNIGSHDSKNLVSSNIIVICSNQMTLIVK